MKEEMLLPCRIKRAMCKEFGFHPRTVDRALKNEGNGPSEELIRAVAKERGSVPFTGKPVVKVVYKEIIIN